MEQHKGQGQGEGGAMGVGVAVDENNREERDGSDGRDHGEDGREGGGEKREGGGEKREGDGRAWAREGEGEKRVKIDLEMALSKISKAIGKAKQQEKPEKLNKAIDLLWKVVEGEKFEEKEERESLRQVMSQVFALVFSLRKKHSFLNASKSSIRKLFQSVTKEKRFEWIPGARLENWYMAGVVGMELYIDDSFRFGKAVKSLKEMICKDSFPWTEAESQQGIVCCMNTLSYMHRFPWARRGAEEIFNEVGKERIEGMREGHGKEIESLRMGLWKRNAGETKRNRVMSFESHPLRNR